MSLANPTFAPNCTALLDSASALIPGLRPYLAQTYSAGSNVTISNTTTFSDLSEFCRFGAQYNTSANSQIQFEVWLPAVDSWNGRFAHAGNGGDLGSISYQEMAVPMTKYGFAMASTNTGHNGSVSDGTFAMNNVESQIDFGWRAVHLSTVFSKAIVNAYYGQNSSYNYWLGCSSGGKQGMREVQGFPEDFDGALTGAPAQWLSRQNGFNIYVGQLNMNETTPGEVVPTSFFTTWAQEVLAQCDEIDGVKDNVILNPRLCTPDTSTVVCGASTPSAYVNSSTCITEGQATTLAAVYKNWTSSVTGELLFPSYDPGSESGWAALLSGTPFGLSSDFFLYQVYNYTTLQPALVVKNETELERITAIGDETDPGQGNAVNPNLTPFFQRGGKLMAYHGSADMNIPSGSSTHYYERLQAYYNSSTDLSNYYRLFLVPGMGHCEGGNGADGFGRPQQQTNGRGESLVFDAEHDAILALMRWVENGTAPDQIISAKYVDNDKSQGVDFTRLLCPYPQEGKYVSGDLNNSTSYICE
ncbi:unnamed protein product [Rhizoctonia solani]|uniref:Carboxylic ester hydrolase n=1 Tax=Rhizoctonia solani TaxID=456999 RepID=A0A8H2ZZF3_9AGAM|nr:unnamed protein product [Rhizoctonia solani]